eukprot:gnl/TRDRNA2_/TRDRNA2_37932_c0_seq1.p1 gnl/TRDRNA2_/TRDRNA2_37932_c0~~gnl/TRDRNA2_/TRDRNA2_37932_c0_seq1.p1  ORF type:complete len:554 (+),score=127.71 gnl/TRDRNA2_/TRDRNA2_37932_c0_seq1:247-1662(+)
MGAEGGVAVCEDLTCGSHGYCAVDAAIGAKCYCKAGYQGDGFVCKPPSQFQPQALIKYASTQSTPQVADMHVSLLQDGHVGVAFRDMSDVHKGKVMVGKPNIDGMTWGEPVHVSDGSSAFGPVLVALPETQAVAIAYRDEDRGGSAVLRGGKFDPITKTVKVGEAKTFAKHQANGMALLPLSGSRVVLIYADHTPPASGAQQQGKNSALTSSGAAMLAELDDEGIEAPKVLGKHRFVTGPIARISAVKLAPDEFIVSYRQGGQSNSDQDRKEASLMWAQMRGNELVFDPHPLHIEPDQTQIWARSAALVDEGTIAYTYHSGNEQLTKQAIVKVDPATHRMKLVAGPYVVAKGFSPLVGSVSLAGPTEDKLQISMLQQSSSSTSASSAALRAATYRSFTYFSQDSGTSKVQAQICSTQSDGLAAGCKDVDWSDEDLASVSGASIGDGRLFLAYTNAKGMPSYQLFGLLGDLD